MNNKKSRVANYSRNMLFSMISQIVIILLGFISRRVFVVTLSAEYLGINGLFSNILTLLSLAELGVGSAITYSLYKPISEDDIKKIGSLMNLYKTVYCIIGIGILLVGTALIPCLDFFVKEMPSIEGIQLIYLLFVVQTASSYFFSYKISYLSATQNDYIVQVFNIISNVTVSVIQIISLLIWHSFIVYIIISIAIPLIKNAYASTYVSKRFPYLSEKAEKLDKNTKKEIGKNVFALSLYKISSTLSVTIDTLLVSKFMGIIEVAIYSNYHLIINYSDRFFTTVLGTITPSLGNYLTDSTKEKKLLMINTLQIVYSWVGTYLAVGLIVLFNPLIEIWLGNEFLFSRKIVISLVISATLTNFQRPCALMRDADGLFWYGKLRPLAMTIINIISSIIFVKIFGTIGVVLGTIVAKACTYVWYDPLVIYKYSIKEKISSYFKNYFIEWGLLIVLAYICDTIYKVQNIKGIVGMIVGFIEITIIVNSALYIIYHKNKSFIYLRNSIKSLIHNKVS